MILLDATTPELRARLDAEQALRRALFAAAMTTLRWLDQLGRTDT